LEFVIYLVETVLVSAIYIKGGTPAKTGKKRENSK